MYCETVGYSREECVGKTSLVLNLIDQTDRQKILNELLAKGFGEEYRSNGAYKIRYGNERKLTEQKVQEKKEALLRVPTALPSTPIGKEINNAMFQDRSILRNFN